MTLPRDTPNRDTAGVSEACKFNDHSDCRAPRCGCQCHSGRVAESLEPVVEQVAANAPILALEKTCPKCGARRPRNESYCRIDGTRLSSLLCGTCGAGGEPGDAYCWKCGSPAGVEGAARVNGSDSDTVLHGPAESPEATELAALQELWAGKVEDAPSQPAAQPARQVMKETTQPKGPKIRVPYRPPE